jgi:hypothetical protein
MSEQRLSHGTRIGQIVEQLTDVHRLCEQIKNLEAERDQARADLRWAVARAGILETQLGEARGELYAMKFGQSCPESLDEVLDKTSGDALLRRLDAYE